LVLQREPDAIRSYACLLGSKLWHAASTMDETKEFLVEIGVDVEDLDKPGRLLRRLNAGSSYSNSDGQHSSEREDMHHCSLEHLVAIVQVRFFGIWSSSQQATKLTD